MSIPSLCIKRPVFTIVLSIVLIIFGIMSYQQLSVRQLPKIERAQVNISTSFDGASPALMEKEITTPIENALSSIAGVENIRSTSQLGSSQVTLTFKLGENIQDSLADIRNKMAAIIDELPESTRAPIVSKVDSDSNPAIIIGFMDSKRDTMAITDYLVRYVKPLVEQQSGVGQVFMFGARDYAIKIWLDSDKMAARNITVADIKQALRQQNVDIPSGQIKSHDRDYTVLTHAKLDKATQFEKLIIKDTNGKMTRLSDVADVNITAENEDSLFRINSKPGVGLAIIPQATANPVEVANNILHLMKEVKANLPKTMHANIVYNSSTFIKRSIFDVYKSLFEAVLFVACVMFLFLGHLRAAFIPLVTVPICLIASFFPLHLIGFSINTITLLALVLAIGLVVDDAIVILENIHRHIQQGLTPIKAAHKGASEILFAVLAMTITLAAVYAPLTFIQGFSGKIFIQFGMTLSIAVIISGIIAITLSPMMCSRLLKKETNRYSVFVDKLFLKLQNNYQQSLRHVLNHKWRYSLMLIIFTVSLGSYITKQLPKTLAPNEDQSFILGMMTPPNNASLKYIDKYSKELEAIYRTIPERNTYLTVSRAFNVFSVVTLKPWNERSRSQQTISDELNKKMQSIVGMNAFAVTPAPLGRRHANNNGFSVRLLSQRSYQDLNEISENIIKQLNDYKGLTNVNKNTSLNSAQFDINIDRNLSAELQLSLKDIADTISTMLGGANPINFNYQGQSYKVMLQLKEDARADLSVMDNLYVQTPDKKNIPLSSLLTIKNTIGADSLEHYNRMRNATINAEISPGYSMGQVIEDVRGILQQHLPDDSHYEFVGAAGDYLKAKGSTALAFLLALVFIYLVMSAQFESFISPFVILLSVPLSLLGALVALKLTHGSLNIYSQLGMVTLIGLIAKHGILITEFTSQLRRQGKPLVEALMQGAALRLRPILMTTSAMILGALPLAFATGAGAEARQQLGIVIVGGMSIGTIFSLYVVPLGYTITYQAIQHWQARRQQPPMIKKEAT